MCTEETENPSIILLCFIDASICLISQLLHQIVCCPFYDNLSIILYSGISNVFTLLRLAAINIRVSIIIYVAGKNTKNSLADLTLRINNSSWQACIFLIFFFILFFYQFLVTAPCATANLHFIFIKQQFPLLVLSLTRNKYETIATSKPSI